MLNPKVKRAASMYVALAFSHLEKPELRKRRADTIKLLAQSGESRQLQYLAEVNVFLKTNGYDSNGQPRKS